MKALVVNNHSSISKNTKFLEEFPDFTIITGENGAGKTHFINAIYDRNIHIFENDSLLNINEQVMIKKDFSSMQKIDMFGQSDNDIFNFKKMMIDYSKQGNTFLKDILNIGDDKRSVEDVLSEIKKSYSINESEENSILTEDQINLWADEHYPSVPPFGQISINDLFYNYFEEQGDSGHLSNNEFYEKYGEEPWNVLNRILSETCKLKFTFEKPTFKNIRSRIVKCKNEKNDTFTVQELSTGEKTLLILAMNLFSKEQKKLYAPKLILLDEIDSCLHPSIIQKLIDLIEKVFVKEYKIKVIFITHSPTTVALADEESLFYMTSDDSNRIVKESKDVILKRLAYGIPTLAVSFANRKYVFTESKYDAINFSSIHRILQNGKLSKEISLAFIPTVPKESTNSSNCSTVSHLAEKCKQIGNIYGILDWDTHNTSKDKIVVNAENERYSIENCILDPVILALLLLSDFTNTYNPEELGLNKGFKLRNNFDVFENEIQNIADIIINRIGEKIYDKSKVKLKTINYVNGKEINVPIWFLECQGHKLEGFIKEIYPEQLKKHHNTNKLLETSINIMSDYPEFIPQCFLDTMNKIIEN